VTQLDELAASVQQHVTPQSWGRHGNDPVPVEMSYDQARRPEPWVVRYVAGVKRDRLVWRHASGRTLPEALVRARDDQAEGSA
jgi:hypothetical protein